MTRYFLLIAGSKGWNNYRHQADVMALSSLLHTDSTNKVITMMADDLVHNPYNPYPGKLFNTNRITNKYNVYNREYIDERNITLHTMKELMNKNNFTKKDSVFIYYNNHGAPGLLCSPKNRDPDNPEFFADDIEEYLQELSHYVGKIMFVIESCYSGSVAKYISIPNVFTIAAANSIQSSYSAKWNSKLNTFTTNLFTLNFLNFINNISNHNRTILDLVNYVSERTLKSTVSAYGDNHFSNSITNYRIEDIFGNISSIPRDNDNNYELINENSIDLRTILSNHYSKKMNTIYDIFSKLHYKSSHDYHEIIFNDYSCFKSVVRTYKQHCSSFSDYDYTYLLPGLADICYHNNISTKSITDVIVRVCKRTHYVS